MSYDSNLPPGVSPEHPMWTNSPGHSDCPECQGDLLWCDRCEGKGEVPNSTLDKKEAVAEL